MPTKFFQLARTFSAPLALTFRGNDGSRKYNPQLAITYRRLPLAIEFPGGPWTVADNMWHDRNPALRSLFWHFIMVGEELRFFPPDELEVLLKERDLDGARLDNFNYWLECVGKLSQRDPADVTLFYAMLKKCRRESAEAQADIDYICVTSDEEFDAEAQQLMFAELERSSKEIQAARLAQLAAIRGREAVWNSTAQKEVCWSHENSGIDEEKKKNCKDCQDKMLKKMEEPDIEFIAFADISQLITEELIWLISSLEKSLRLIKDKSELRLQNINTNPSQENPMSQNMMIIQKRILKLESFAISRLEALHKKASLTMGLW